MNDIRIAIIDSGIDEKRKEFVNANIELINEATDNIGHGTAVASIIHKITPNSSLHIYKLFNSNDDLIDSERLIEALSYMKNNNYDIIHLSCGVVSTDRIDELYRTCLDLTQKGTIIVAAYDNCGCISYPAAFDNVIGVDWDIQCSDGLKYTFVNGSPINILGVGSLLRLPWLNGKYQTVAGSSFAAPYISGIVANYLSKGNKANGVNKYLFDNADKTISISNTHFSQNQKTIKINKAIAFPVNKEIHNILTYKELLDFELVGAYEPSLFRNVGKKANEICGFGNCQLIIQSDKNIHWESDFDTLILGHTTMYSKALQKNIIYELLQKCLKYKKNIYAFDDLSEYQGITTKIINNGNFCYYPCVNHTDVDKRFMNKLYGITSPVLGIVGTSSKQGKFSLQLSLMKHLKKQGYKIGGIGTEPSSLLFGFDYVYPMGYEANIHIGRSDAIRTVNRFVHEIDLKSPDLIIVGSQSQTVPYSTGNISLYPLLQHEFLIGAEPDAMILCINPFDDIDYIKRTIEYINGYLNSKVIAISIFPKANNYEWAIYGSHAYSVDETVLVSRKNMIELEIKIPCIIFDSEENVLELINIITSFFCNNDT